MKTRTRGGKDYIIGVDLGGTNIVSAVVTFEGRRLSRDKRPTEASRGREAVVSNIIASAKQAILSSGIPLSKIAGLGIGSPGPLNTRTGIVHKSPNLPFNELPLRQLVQRRFPFPVFLENDANAAAWGEAWLGAGQGYRHILVLTLGTGIGGGIILDGKLWRGPDDTAGEIGHMTLFPDGVRCNCGNHGCLEVYASATAIARRTREAIQAGEPSVLKTMVRGDLSRITSALVHQGVLQGDRLSRRIMAETAAFLGIAVGSLVNIFNPEIVIFSGGVISAGRWLFDPVRREIKRRAFPVPVKRVKIVPAKLGDDAGVIGAAGIAREYLLA